MKKLLLLAASVVFITSCGGGGGGGGSTPSAPTPQNISVSLTASADSAEVNSSITLTWSSTLATSCSASGSWSGSKSTSGSESITIGVGGSNSFSLSCSATGANSGSASTSVNGLRYFDGKVFDGYIRGAEVFVDTNDNLALDANEASVATDNAGGFTKLLFGNGTLVSKGGFDLDTGAELSDLTLVHKLDGYETSKLASPFTTLIAYMDDASTINAALGIDASINLLTTDPIPNLGDGIYDQMYEKGNQLTVLAYTLQNQAAADSSQLYFQAIADQLEESYAANQVAVDIEDPTFISNVIDKAETASATTLSPDVKANLNTVLAITIPLLKVYADSNTTASVQRFAFSTLQNDVQDSAVIGSSTSATIAQYENNVFGYVATDQGIDETTINPINNNAPTISSSATFSAAENQTAIGSISATDADGDSLTYSISGSEINISSSGVLTFASAPDYETKNSYTATVTVSDGTDSVSQSITVSITDVDETVPNEAPTFTSSATFSVAENNTDIGSVSATDADGDSLTYSISGSEINISSSGVLTFASAPDYETKNSYTATVTVSDGTASVTQSISINILNLNDNNPVISSSATFSLAENNTAIGLINSSDADGDSLTHSISGSEINISSSGVLSFAAAPDYETKNSYTATVTVSDGTNSATQSITVTITDVDETSPNNTPTISSSATFSASENQTAIGSVTATDADGDSLTYSISGSEINISSSGVLSFATAPDYETKNSYTATVTVSDGTASTTQNITVNVTDVNENVAPTIGSSATFSAAENQTAIGSVTATDADGDSLTYSISGSEINISSSGVLSFAAAPDYETKNSYTATVTVSDGTAPVTQSITVNVSNENEAPYFYDMNQDWNNTYGDIKIAEIYENTIQNLFKIRAIDPDGDDLTFSLSGPGASFFNFIYESSPYSWLRNKEEFDFENTTSLSITVNVSDGTFSASEVLTLYILNENDNSPVISSSATFGAAENQTAIGSVTATDADGDSLTYSISGSEINISSSGVLSFAAAPDYETKNSYTATVTVRDGINTNSTTQGITVNVTDVNENVAPTIGSSATFSAAENQTAIGSVTATDADGDSLTYSISGSEINISSSGVLTFATAPDYETKSSYTATVTVSDGAASTTQNIIINVGNLNDNSPSFSTGASFSADENQTAIGTVTARDADGDAFTFSISGSELSITSSGVLTFVSAPDYEAKNSYTATVTVSDGPNSATQNIIVNVGNLNDNSPSFSTGASFSADENQTAIGTVTARDADGDAFTFSISGSELSITSSGVLTFVSAPDYEIKSTYSATITASDGSNSSTQTISVNVNNMNEVKPSLSLSINAIKSFAFSWSDTDDATSYKLLERVTPSSSYSQIGTDINQGTGSYNYIAPLHTRVNASYVLQACYNTNCIDSDTVSVSGNLASAIGFVKASNSEAEDIFGYTIALSGDGNTLAISSGDDSNATGINGDQTNNSAAASGAVYVFIRNGSTWSQQAYIKASNTFTSYQFGASVSLSDDGNTLAVGQTGDKSNSTGVNGDDSRYWLGNGGYGSAFIFTRSGSTWSQKAYLKASNPDVNDSFGESVSISGDGMTLAVGASGEDGAYTQSGFDENDNSASSAGAVYVFALIDSTWSQQAYLKDSNSLNDNFGDHLSLSDDGDTLAISRIGWDAGVGGAAGSVLVFYRTGTTWDQVSNQYVYANLIASNPDSQDRFGDSLSLSGDGNTLAVAAPSEDSNATGIGGDQSNNSLTNSGAVYIFTRSGNSWSQQAYIKSSSTDDRDYFGTSVSLSDDGNTLAASSYLEDGNAIGMGGDTSNNSAINSGAVFVFSRTGSSWSEIDYVKSNNTEAGDCFGKNSGSVSISDDGKTLAVGNYCDDSNATGIGGDETDNSAVNSGAVYIY